jgi:filamentous hemagglutinin
MLSAPNNVTNQLPGLVIGQFDMVTDPGPLASFPSNPAANFASGKYTAITLTEDVVLYRGGSSAGSPLGQWFTAEPPSSVAQVRIDSAVKPQWIDPVPGQLTGSSPVDTLYSVRVPAGSTIYQGPVGYQGGVYLGGSGPTQTQIFIPRTTPGLQPVNAAPLH